MPSGWRLSSPLTVVEGDEFGKPPAKVRLDLSEGSYTFCTLAGSYRNFAVDVTQRMLLDAPDIALKSCCRKAAQTSFHLSSRPRKAQLGSQEFVFLALH